MTLPTTPDEATALADRILGGDNPLENEQVQAVLIKAAMDHMKGGTNFDQGGFLADVQHVLQPYMRNMLDLASWMKDPEAHATLGLQISLVDVFSAWGEREARDTAMLIDLCLAAALDQLVPFTVPDTLWPAAVEIKAETLQRIADAERVVRLQPEPNVWRVRLLPPGEGDGRAPLEAFGMLGTIRRYLTAFEDYHSYYETLADSVGEDKSALYHTERRKLGGQLLAVLDAHGGAADTPPADEAAESI
jgi:hypothetical protein